MRLAVLVFLAACASRGMDAPLARLPVTPTSPPVEALDELVRFHAPETPEAAFAIRDDGAIVIAHREVQEPAWSIDAVDAAGTRLWSQPIRGPLSGLVAFPGGRVGVFTRTATNADTDIAIVGPRGDTLATATFTSLTGSGCTKSNRYWLVRSGEAVVAQVVCGASWKRVSLDAELHDVRQTTEVGSASMYAERWYFDDNGDDVALVHDGQRTVLAPRSKLRTFATPSLAEVRDGVVSILSLDEYRDATQRPRFTARGIVQRHGARAWSVELVPSHLTDDPATVSGVASTPSDDVVVAITHGNDVQLAGAQLPAPRLTPDTRFPLDHALSLAELDGTTGAIKRVLALRPRTAWHVQPWSALAVSSHNIVVANGDDVLVFPRAGRPEPAAAAQPTIPPPLATSLPAPAVARAEASWMRVCGPRIAQKRNAPCRIDAVAVGKDGSVVIGGGYYGANQLDTVKLPQRAYETSVLAAFAPDGRLRWFMTPGVSWHNLFSQVFVRDDGSIVVAGVHGQNFALDGKRLPERTVTHHADGSDNGFEADTPFLAILDRDGHAQLLEDADAMLFGDRSTDPKRVCLTTVALGDAPDELWLRGDCDHDTRRVQIRGVTASPAEVIALRPEGAWPRTLDAHGTLVDGFPGETTTFLLSDDLAHGRTVPLFAGHTTLRQIATTPGGTWMAATVPLVSGRAWKTALQVALVTSNGTVTVRELTAVAEGRLDVTALTVDEAGRPIVALAYDHALTLGGVDIPAPAELTNVFVRLSADGMAIERVIAPTASNGCAHPEGGEIHGIAARGDRLAVVFQFAVDRTCGVKDEPTTLAVFDLR